jgi:pimeloyl-ACP methyl ester carboxylesterase
MTTRDEFCKAADGLGLFYRDYAGERPVPVLCIPGLTRNSQDFAALAQRLSPRYRVLTPDLRGRGRSAWDPNWQNYRPRTYVADVMAVLEHAQVQRVAIVGTSLGGIIGMLLGASFPQRIAGLVLNDVGPEIAPEAAARIEHYVSRRASVRNWEEAAQQARETYGAALPDYSDKDWLHFAHRSYREDGTGAPVLDMDPGIGEAVRAAAATGPAPTMWPVWAALQSIPTLVIRGEHSDVLSIDILRRMATSSPGVRTLTVPQRGHAPTLDEPVCVDAIEQFMECLPENP